MPRLPSSPVLLTPLLTPLHQFDDLAPPKEARTPLYDPPRDYRGLHFSGFSVFEPASPALAPVLHPLDTNCAASAPNALLGSILDGKDVPRLAVLEEDTAFALLGLTLKPLAAPPGNEEITIYAHGFSNASSNPLEWYVAFPVGWHRPFAASFPSHWTGLRRVTLWAEYGPDSLDWEFCIDDIRIRWTGRGTSRNSGEKTADRGLGLEL